MAGISSKALNGALENKKGYNGNELQNKEFSDGSGLEAYDFNARTYNQQIGRFIQIDPLFEEDQESLNPYHFSFNNPIRFSDPDGRAPTDIHIRGANNSSVTIKTSLINVDIDASSLGVNFGGNYTLGGSNIVHAGLDIAGIFDPTGAADVANATLYAQEGNKGDAVISGLGVFPLIGDAAKIGRIGQAIDKVGDAIRASDKVSDGSKMAKGLEKAEAAAKGTKGNSSGATDFVVNNKGEVVPIPKGAKGPSSPNKGSGMGYQGGVGGKGMDKKTTGVRIMDANANQGRRVSYMNKSGQTVDPKTGKTIPNNDPRGHVPYGN